MKKSNNKIDSSFAIAMWMFFFTQIIAGFFGGNAIWQSVGMENFSTYVLLMYMLASKSISSELKNKKRGNL
jgi:DMSO/TMAO reductase YedYZ heme-binding membrane subunit